ncbi:MAG: hypothetical protein AB7G35_23425, partial [Hyphomicrobiaceae bacterium]
MAAVVRADVPTSSRRGHDVLSWAWIDSLTPRTVTATEVAAYGKYPLAQCLRRATWMSAVVRADVPTSPRRGHDGLAWVDISPPHRHGRGGGRLRQVSACAVFAASHVDGRR